MSPLPTQPQRLVEPDVEDEKGTSEPAGRSLRVRVSGLRGRRKESVSPTTRWSDGAAWTTRAITGGVLLAIACGPVGLVMDAVRDEPEPLTMAQVQAADDRLSAREDVAREAAAELVSVWAAATEGEHGRLEQLVGEIPQGGLPAKPLQVQDVRAMSATPVAPGVWSVSVSGLAQVDNRWSRMVWKVPVSVAGGEDTEAAASVMALPAQVATPAGVSTPPKGSYPVAVPSGPLSKTISDFLMAMLAGGEGLDRVTAPDSQIAAVDPAAYKKVEVDSIQAAAVPQGTNLDSPRDGQRVQTSVDVQLHPIGSKDSAGRPGRYYLTLEARAGRWEVAAIDDFPVMQENTPNTKE